MIAGVGSAEAFECSGSVVRLREIGLTDAELLDEWRKDPESMGEFNDFGVEMEALSTALAAGRRFVEEEMGRVLVERIDDGTVVGDMSWHPVRYGPGDGSKAFNMGISLHPDHRGKGYGVEAQRLLADLLLERFGVARVEASTDIENLPEQRALEKAGFTREGVLRKAQHRAGAHHDLVVYSRVRGDA